MQIPVAVLDTNSALLEMLEQQLRNGGFEPMGFVRRDLFWRFIQEEPPSLVVIDRDMGDKDGLDLLKMMRKLGMETPVFLISEHFIQESDRIEGYQAGCDDYLIKPFSPLEFLARCHAIIRRSDPAYADTSYVMHRGLFMNVGSRQVTRDGRPIVLTPVEFRLLKEFLKNTGRILSREHLAHHCLSRSNSLGELDGRRISVAINRLRDKLADHEREYIHTIRNQGYMLE